ncbi:MAG: hypothetical protein E6L00_00495 [Thaumarchaeota archaeon]|nr:MAG: hypothetical protein E6L00_00495 [Nitrososphaerota archaeon]
MIFHRKPEEIERIEEIDGDLRCEDAIMNDKEKFGRVRKSMMKYLKAKYGDDVAKRALWRVNRRRTEGYFKS